jgi:acetolactate synthase-1/2/3 large subunit
MKIRVADYIISRLEKENIKNIFQVTGRGALFLNDAVAKSIIIEGISMHHEQACAYAAIAAAEQLNNIGVCLVSTGCAATNTITGVLCAWQDGVPLIVISGQNFLRETTRYTGANVRTFGQQEADIIELVKPITKYAEMLEKAQDIVRVLEEALSKAKSGRKGPVFIDIPLDLQSALIEVNEETIKLNDNDYLKKISKTQTENIDQIEAAFAVAKRPVLLIGKGIANANSSSELKDFSERFGIPVTFSTSAPDTYGLKNLNSIGSVGAMGCSRAGNLAVQNSDLILVLGSRLTALTTGPEFCKFGREAKIIVVDIDPNEHSKDGIEIDLLIEADLRLWMKSLLDAHVEAKYHDWLEKCLHWKNKFSGVEDSFKSEDLIDLYELADTLGRIVPDNSTILTDSGLNEVIIPSNMAFSDRINCIHSASQGAMGFALPASIGAQVTKSDKLVIPIIGDGSIMMNLQELETIRAHALPIKILVINNNVYSIIRRRQKDLFRTRTIGTDPSNGVTVPNFSEIANCFGLQYVKIEKTDELEQILSKVFESTSSVLCEIHAREDQNYIELGYAKSSENKRFVRRPLEDQVPFIDRELLKREMIIDLIDQ